jgi:hypothetical protein
MEKEAKREGCACGAPAKCQSHQGLEGRAISQANDANAAAGEGSRRSLSGRACDLYGTLVLDDKRVPIGPCSIRQARGRTILSWADADGSRKTREISNALLRQLFDEGLLQRRNGG